MAQLTYQQRISIYLEFSGVNNAAEVRRRWPAHLLPKSKSEEVTNHFAILLRVIFKAFDSLFSLQNVIFKETT